MNIQSIKGAYKSLSSAKKIILGNISYNYLEKEDSVQQINWFAVNGLVHVPKRTSNRRSTGLSKQTSTDVILGEDNTSFGVLQPQKSLSPSITPIRCTSPSFLCTEPASNLVTFATETSEPNITRTRIRSNTSESSFNFRKSLSRSISPIFSLSQKSSSLSLDDLLTYQHINCQFLNSENINIHSLLTNQVNSPIIYSFK